MIGYFSVLVLVMAISVYAILKLHASNTAMRHIIRVDYLILDYEKKLADSILAQLRYEKRYIITRDAIFYNQFLSEKEEFDRSLTIALSMADTPQKKDSLEKVKTAYGGYQSLIDKEVGYVRTNQSYHRKWFEYEKEKVVNAILEELQMLVTHSRRDIQDRVEMLKEFTFSARAFAILMSALAIILAIATAFFFTRGIAKPLRVLMDKTKEISKGVFECNLNVSSPPEIVELAKAFNLMCGRLREVEQIKSDFFSSMSHELRTPLTSIKEGISLLKDGVGGVTTDKQSKLLAILSMESDRLINLVNSLLDLAKMEAGMVTYTFGEGKLAPLIGKVIMEMTPLVEARKISLEAKGSEELPLLKMDGERILQALRNLVGNALKFTPPGGQITVSTRLANSKIEVAVTDTGPGIPEENLTTIFEKFHQAPFKYSSQTKGTGLGLAIVRHIITAHGGKVWAESQPGKGSTFIFQLPA
jgi:two-component system sensor histidine kinase GlrK